MIEGIQKGAVLADQCDLGGGGTGINAQVAAAASRLSALTDERSSFENAPIPV